MASLTPEQIYQVCLQAGFTPDQAVTWTAIAMAESGGNPAAHNPRGEDSWGLWQINVDPEVRPNHWGDLTDPLTNARAAFEISGGGTNMRPWTVTHASNEGTNKDYRNFMDEAQAASGNTAQGDFSGVSGYDDPSGMGPDEPGVVLPAAPEAAAAPATPVAAVTAPPAPATGVDTDADGVLDDFEMSQGTDPNSPDTDDDGLTDGFEALHGSDPLKLDSDQDGLSDGREARLETNALEADTDQDGMSDSMELAAGRDPLHGAAPNGAEGEGSEGEGGQGGPGEGGSAEGEAGGGSSGVQGQGEGEAPAVDTDDDGLSDAWETSRGTDPTQADTDDDDIPDALEQAGGTDPLRADSDGDGMLDGLDPDDTDGPGLGLGLGPGGLGDVGAGGLNGGDLGGGGLDGGGLGGLGGGADPILPPTQVLAAPGVPGAVVAPAMPAAPAAPVAVGAAPAVGVPPVGVPPVPAAPVPAAPAPAPPPPPESTMQQFLDAALDQQGDPYVWAAEVNMEAENPEAFDCSELVEWAASQAGVEVPDGSWNQYLDLEEQGGVMSVEEAARTPGALLFRFSSDPTAGGGRPAQAHVAISLGDGRTIEARGTDYGVGTFEVGDRFTHAAVIPGLSGAAGVPSDDALAGFPALPPPAAPATPLDSDHDGVTDAYEMSSGTNPLLGDSDADGLTDGFELQTGASGTALDSDHDGLSDAYEVGQVGTAPSVVDSDRDGLSDALELAAGRDALHGAALDGQLGLAGGQTTVLDADHDGLSDAWESSLGSSAADEDSDHDGLTDALELVRATNPRDPDSDEDGFTDGLDDD